MSEEIQEVQNEDKMIKVLNHGFVRLVDSMGDDSSIVQAARVSYGKGTKTVSEDEGLIRYLMKHQHTTPFEMVEFKFHCKMPVFVARQWIRHRTASVNEYSGRYSEMKDEFFVPEESTVTKQNPNNKQGGTAELVPLEMTAGIQWRQDPNGPGVQSWEEVFKREQKDSRFHYEQYLGSGMRKELARINLPMSVYTEWYWKIDLHNLFHFLKLRMDSHAQYEIRVFAEAMYELIKDIVPLACKAFEDYKRNAKTLSAAEQSILCDLINAPKHSFITPCRGIYDSSYGLTKREWLEFFDWLDNLKGKFTLPGNIITAVFDNEKKGNI